ncbi:MAG: HDOD domain-containing protein, partial [Treponema sp.]|nr:HDOD domain-containing protein [Treponema sp.]
AILVNLAAKKSTGLDMDEFWRHSLGTGLMARLIAQKRNVANAQLEEYFIAGLLHDIGKIPMSAINRDKYTEAMELAAREHISLYRAEKRVLDFDHCEVGKTIVEVWHLEGAVGDVIGFHHSCLEYTGPYRDILYTVAMANRFSSMTGFSGMGFSGDRHSEPLAPEILKYIAVDEDILGEFESTVKKKIDDALVFLES